MSWAQKSVIVLTTLVLCAALAMSLPGALTPAQAQDQNQNGDQISVTVDDDRRVPYPEPVIADGRALVPVFFIAGALGAQVSWDAGKQTATITQDGNAIELIAGSKTAFLNGNPVDLGVPGRIIQDRFFAPARFVAESLGARVVWNGADQVIEITSKQALEVKRAYSPALPARVAFTNNGYLWLMDGSKEGSLPVQVTHDGTSSIVGWSPDGRWLAYLLSPDRESGAIFNDNNSLWVVKADGSGTYQVDPSPVLAGQALDWSPVDDTIAYFAEITDQTGQQFTGFDLKLAHIQDGGAKASILLSEGSGVFDFAWAPDGQSLTVSIPCTEEHPLLIDRITLQGERTHLLQLGEKRTSDDEMIFPWGAQGLKWSPDGRYLAYYLRSNSGSLSADGVSIQLLDLSKVGRTVDLGGGLKYSQWLAWSPDSQQLAFINGGGREATKDKHLFIASMVDGKITDCGSTGQVDTQPVWTQQPPYRVAFCRGLENLNWEGRNGYWGVMVPGQQIWLGDSSSGRAATVAPAETSAIAPSVSPDGNYLVYLRLNRMFGGSLYLASLNGGSEAELISGLTGSPGYYGNYYPVWVSIYWEH